MLSTAALSLLLTTLLTTTTLAHPASVPNNKRALLHCGPTTYSPDQYYCANPSTGQVIAVLPHGTDGSTLSTPQNQPSNTAPAYVSPTPVPAGQIPHEGTVSVDNGGSGTGTGTGNGGGGSGGGGTKVRRQQEIQTLPHGVHGSLIVNGGQPQQQQQQQQQQQSGDGSVPSGVDPGLGKVHVDGNGGGD